MLDDFHNLSMDQYAKTESAAHSGAFGNNQRPMPTEKQCISGNYKKGRVSYRGLILSIEQPRNSYRSGTGADGKPWSTRLAANYGGVVGVKGADNDLMDVFIGPWPESDTVWVINQVDQQTRRFDESKCMLCFPDEESARNAYMHSYERGWRGLGSMVKCSVDQFKWWLKFGNHKKPLEPRNLPFDGSNEMTEKETVTVWDSEANPVGNDLAGLIYGIRREDKDSLMLDAVTVSAILEDSDGEMALDALVVPVAKLERKMEQLKSIMNGVGESVFITAMQVTPPFKQRGTTNIAVVYELSDGQTISIYLHNPDSTPNKLAPTDELVSWKWLLNRKDVTIVVAPERGEDLNPREVGRRIMKLAEKNSSRFAQANKNRSERLAGIESMKGDVAAKEAELETLSAEIVDLTAKVEAKKNAPESSIPVTAEGNEIPEITEILKRHIPAIVDAAKTRRFDATSIGYSYLSYGDFTISAKDSYGSQISVATVQGSDGGGVKKAADVLGQEDFDKIMEIINGLKADIAEKEASGYWKERPFNKINSIKMLWSEGSKDEDLSFGDMTSLQGWFLKTFGGSKLRDSGYDKTSIEIEVENKDGETFKISPRVDVGMAGGDFNPFGKTILDYLESDLGYNMNTPRKLTNGSNLYVDLSGQSAGTTGGESEPAWKSVDPTSAEGYAAVMAGGEEAALYWQDKLDSFFQGRIVDVRNALRELDWFGDKLTFTKGDYRFSYDVAGVGAGRNIVGVNYEVYDSKNVTVFSVKDDLSKTAEQLSAEINASVQPVANEFAYDPASPSAQKAYQDETARVFALGSIKDAFDRYMADPNGPSDKSIGLNEFAAKFFDENSQPELWNLPVEAIKAMSKDDYDAAYYALEDWNFHPENVLLEAKRLGNEDDVKEASDLLSSQRNAGGLSGEMMDRRKALQEKLSGGGNADKDFIQSTIDGKADFYDKAVTDRLAELAGKYPDGEMAALMKKAKTAAKNFFIAEFQKKAA